MMENSEITNRMKRGDHTLNIKEATSITNKQEKNAQKISSIILTSHAIAVRDEESSSHTIHKTLHTSNSLGKIISES